MLVCPKCGSTYTREQERCGLDGDVLVESNVDPLVGRTIDRYTIRDLLGAGGMASVYRASHAFLEQDFAIKVLHGQFAADKTIARRFVREGKALARIKHPNVVSVADFGTTAEGLLFMVMEFVDGRTLSRALREDGPFPPARTAHVVREIAQGLGAAHKRGFVHRDLKPGNVILHTEAGHESPKILDFGLVGILESEEPQTQLTLHGQFFGTPSYMSPEQASGGTVDERSDLYSLGVMMYVMLTGSPPFDGEIRELAYKHISEEPPRPPLPYAGLTSLVMELLEKSPEDRPKSTAEVVRRVDELGLVTHSGRPTKKGLLARRPKKAPPTLPTKEAPTRSERPMLSEPVLAEERNFMTSPSDYGDDDSVELQREALGLRRHRSKLIAFVLIALLGVGAWRFVESDAFALRQIRAFFSSDYTPKNSPKVEPIESEERAEVEPERAPDPPLVAPKPMKPKAPVAPPPAKKPTAPPPRKPAVVETPEPPPPPPPPVVEEEEEEEEEVVTEIALPEKEEAPVSGKTFRELDIALGWALNSKGLAWADLAEAADEDAKNWSRWFKTEGDPPQKILDQTYTNLVQIVERIIVDAELLKHKLDRAERTLGRIPRDARGTRHAMLDSRLSALRRDVNKTPLPKRAVDLAAEITLLEADAAGELTSATTAPPPPPPPPVEEDEDETPEITDTSTSGG